MNKRIIKGDVLNDLLEAPSSLMLHFTALETEAQTAQVAKLNSPAGGSTEEG